MVIPVLMMLSLPWQVGFLGQREFLLSTAQKQSIYNCAWMQYAQLPFNIFLLLLSVYLYSSPTSIDNFMKRISEQVVFLLASLLFERTLLCTLFEKNIASLGDGNLLNSRISLISLLSSYPLFWKLLLLHFDEAFNIMSNIPFPFHMKLGIPKIVFNIFW